MNTKDTAEASLRGSPTARGDKSESHRRVGSRAFANFAGRAKMLIGLSAEHLLLSAFFIVLIFLPYRLESKLRRWAFETHGSPQNSANENKMSRREWGRAWLRIDGLNSYKARSYGGSRSAPSHG